MELEQEVNSMYMQVRKDGKVTDEEMAWLRENLMKINPELDELRQKLIELGG